MRWGKQKQAAMQGNVIALKAVLQRKVEERNREWEDVQAKVCWATNYRLFHWTVAGAEFEIQDEVPREYRIILLQHDECVLVTTAHWGRRGEQAKLQEITA